MSLTEYFRKPFFILKTSLCLPLLSPLLHTPIISSAYAEDVLGQEVGQKLQKALTSHNYAKAMSAVDAADHVSNKNDYENYIIAQMRAAIAASSGDTNAAIKAYDVLISSPRTPKAAKAQMIMAQASLAYSAKNYAEATKAAERYLSQIGSNQQMETVLIQSYYLQQDWSGLIKAGENILHKDEQTKSIPAENMLQMLATAYDRMHDLNGQTTTYVALVQHYPRPQYWQILIHNLVSDTTLNPRLVFNVQRLRLATNSLTNPSDFQDMGERAIQMGLPQLALNLLNIGYDRHILGVGATSAQEAHFRDFVTQQAEITKKNLPASVVKAQKETSANDALTSGYNLILNGETDKGISLIKLGLTKHPRAPEIAQLEYGMALMDANKIDDALNIFNAITGDKKIENIAKLWSVYLQSTQKPQKH